MQRPQRSEDERRGHRQAGGRRSTTEGIPTTDRFTYTDILTSSCLAIAQVLLGFPGERHWIRYARKNLRHLFPYIPQQSGYGKRLRNAGPLIARVIRVLAENTPTTAPILRLIDSTPVPCGASRPTVQRSDLAGDAGYGYCASHSRFFWGMRLYLVATVEGMPLMWCLAHPKLDEREVVAALLEVDHHLISSGQVILADKGFAGRDFAAVLDQLGLHLVRPARRNSRDPQPGPVEQQLLRMRQWIEAIFDTLKGQLSLEQHGARRASGLYARVGQRLLAMAAAIWHNTLTDAPTKRSLIAYDH